MSVSSGVRTRMYFDSCTRSQLSSQERRDGLLGKKPSCLQFYLAIEDTRVGRDKECVHSLPPIESLRRTWPMNVLSDLLTMTHGSWSVALGT